MARAEAKDAVQEVMESQGFVYRAQALGALKAVEMAAGTLAADAEQRGQGMHVITDAECDVAEQAIISAYGMIEGKGQTP